MFWIVVRYGTENTHSADTPDSFSGNSGIADTPDRVLL